MTNWHYYNKNGDKVGPISVAALKSLAQQGLITRETVIENHTGRAAKAGEVSGLTFPETAPPEAASESATPLPLSVDNEVYGLASPQPAVTPPPILPVQPAIVSPEEADPFVAATSRLLLERKIPKMIKLTLEKIRRSVKLRSS